MTGRRIANYYRARGFSVYYLVNAIFNIVSTPMAFIRGIEDILGDMRTISLMRPFHIYTNLHQFIRDIATDILTEQTLEGSDKNDILQEFLKVYNILHPIDALETEDSFWRFASESEDFDNALDELTDEVFHVLFNDVAFLHKFNQLCAGYIQYSGFGDECRTQSGTLKRVRPPAWARRAIFHRDKGECRSCKRDLSAIVNQRETGCYDHIVPLARFGPNDVTNLQLLCQQCNSDKSADNRPVSRLYQRAIRS